jgi:hypothetical protein
MLVLVFVLRGLVTSLSGQQTAKPLANSATGNACIASLHIMLSASECHTVVWYA